MEEVLIAGSIMACGHAGTTTLTGNAKLTVNGQSVMLANEFGSWTLFAGCTQVPTQASPNNKPCTKVTSITEGVSTKLFVGGVPVLLKNIKGMTEGSPKNTDVSVSTSQSIFKSV